MKLVFEKMAELFQDSKENDISEDDNKENLNIQVNSKRLSEVPDKEDRKRTCIRSTE